MPRRDTAQLAQQDDPYRNPNFQRRWDHSPYSFRADWAESLPVGKQLETLGRELREPWRASRQDSR